MKKKSIIFLVLAVASAVIGTTCLLQNGQTLAQTNGVKEYSITITSEELEVADGCLKTIDKTTQDGNLVQFNYTNTKLINDKIAFAPGGMLYNTTRITGLQFIQTDLNNGVQLSYGFDSPFEYGDYFSDPSLILLSSIECPNYFQIDFIKEDTEFSFIKITYSCVGAQQKEHIFNFAQKFPFIDDSPIVGYSQWYLPADTQISDLDLSCLYVYTESGQYQLSDFETITFDPYDSKVREGRNEYLLTCETTGKIVEGYITITGYTSYSVRNEIDVYSGNLIHVQPTNVPPEDLEIVERKLIIFDDFYRVSLDSQHFPLKLEYIDNLQDGTFTTVGQKNISVTVHGTTSQLYIEVFDPSINNVRYLSIMQSLPDAIMGMTGTEYKQYIIDNGFEFPVKAYIQFYEETPTQISGEIYLGESCFDFDNFIADGNTHLKISYLLEGQTEPFVTEIYISVKPGALVQVYTLKQGSDPVLFVGQEVIGLSIYEKNVVEIECPMIGKQCMLYHMDGDILTAEFFGMKFVTKLDTVNHTYEAYTVQKVLIEEIEADVTPLMGEMPPGAEMQSLFRIYEDNTLGIWIKETIGSETMEAEYEITSYTTNEDNTEYYFFFAGPRINCVAEVNNDRTHVVIKPQQQ